MYTSRPAQVSKVYTKVYNKFALTFGKLLIFNDKQHSIYIGTTNANKLSTQPVGLETNTLGENENEGSDAQAVHQDADSDRR